MPMTNVADEPSPGETEKNGAEFIKPSLHSSSIYRLETSLGHHAQKLCRVHVLHGFGEEGAADEDEAAGQN